MQPRPTVIGTKHYHAREQTATTYMTQAKTFTVDAPRRGRAEGGLALRIVRMRPKRRGGLRNDQKRRRERRGAPFIDVVYRTRYIGRVASARFLGLRSFCVSIYNTCLVESIMRMLWRCYVLKILLYKKNSKTIVDDISFRRWFFEQFLKNLEIKAISRIKF